MTRGDGAETLSLQDAEVQVLGLMLDGLGMLALLVKAAQAEAPDGVTLDEVQRPAVRLVIDERAGMVALGAIQADGTVRQLQGYNLTAVRARLRELACGGQLPTGRPPQWH